MPPVQPCPAGHWLCAGPYTPFGFFCCPKCNDKYRELVAAGDPQALELEKTLNPRSR